MIGTRRRWRLGLRGACGALAVFVFSSAANAQPTVPEPPPPTEPWYEAIQLRAFADAYYNVNFGFPKPQDAAPPTRRFDTVNGFALSWIGLDAVYEPEPVGGVVSLRFGPSAHRYAAFDDGTGLEYVKQAYASWRPDGADGIVTLDFGKFDTLFGFEVAESQDNFNYTRGVVNYLVVPSFHTGLRASVELLPELTLSALVVNGWNRSIDNNIGKTYALQAGISPSPAFGASIGWIGGPEQDDSTSVRCAAGTAYDPAAGGCAPEPGAEEATHVVDRGGANDFEAWRHLFDVVLTVQPFETLALSLSGDYGIEGVRPADTSIEAEPDTKRWYAGALHARLQLDETWALAGRGEYLADPEGHVLPIRQPNGENFEDIALVTGTLTIEARPTDNLILRLEGRCDAVLEAAPTKKIYQKREREASSELYTATLGVVVTTN